MSSPPSTPTRPRPLSYPLSIAVATPTALFLTPTRSNDPFSRSQLPEQVLYSSGTPPNRMSVFGFLSSQPPPPQYNNPPTARMAPSSYKAPLDIQPSPLSSHPLLPPPVYQPNRPTIRVVEKEAGEVEMEVEMERPSMSEPPQYDSQAEREKAEERRRNRDSIVKDKMVETSSDGTLDDTEEKEATRITKPQAKDAKDEESGCFGFGGPATYFWNLITTCSMVRKQGGKVESRG